MNPPFPILDENRKRILALPRPLSVLAYDRAQYKRFARGYGVKPEAVRRVTSPGDLTFIQSSLSRAGYTPTLIVMPRAVESEAMKELLDAWNALGGVATLEAVDLDNDLSDESTSPALPTPNLPAGRTGITVGDLRREIEGLADETPILLGVLSGQIIGYEPAVNLMEVSARATRRSLIGAPPYVSEHTVDATLSKHVAGNAFTAVAIL